jgi:hypothetical protein
LILPPIQETIDHQRTDRNAKRIKNKIDNETKVHAANLFGNAVSIGASGTKTYPPNEERRVIKPKGDNPVKMIQK